ncbi:MAG: hypothetical protein HC840_20620 [Leptolyngbyaceae cyanobacterium RM2_2_4]|nr:hypothetical protein [Leptolyngbyaceae cyanobacterium RM2_2_4]
MDQLFSSCHRAIAEMKGIALILLPCWIRRWEAITPSAFPDTKQQKQLSELMSLWRSARDQGAAFSPEQQAELDSLVEAELRAATARTAQM